MNQLHEHEPVEQQGESTVEHARPLEQNAELRVLTLEEIGAVAGGIYSDGAGGG